MNNASLFSGLFRRYRFIYVWHAADGRRLAEGGRYGEMPDMYNMVLNTDSPLIKELLDNSNEERISQLIDLALLQNGMLSGEALTKFVKRSVSMIK